MSSTVKKLRIVGNTCVGASGSAFDCEAFIAWWEKKYAGTDVEWPGGPFKDNGSFEGLVYTLTVKFSPMAAGYRGLSKTTHHHMPLVLAHG